MILKKPLQIEHDLTNQRYLKCLAEGMLEWIEVKSNTGNEDIKTHRRKLEQEISPSSELPRVMFNKMKSFGIKKETLEEFKGVFLI
ncbi:hypothetical protein COU53_02475 [Candidatus Pacearchaeota archaeon CG10_big_fil_rev_8_21_14_0_10_30_48]|nr:MAG: hypothetical protein COU53_02475 [Candidatus Pacearchaeota archaeon CG10_big_fil_rev_8_21_14_0_10_30_48]